jgi:5-hydroxyisourate hydrolase
VRLTRRSGLCVIGQALLPLAPHAVAEPLDEPPVPRGPLAIHALNTTTGKPAIGLDVTLERKLGNDWEVLGRGRTDDQGLREDLYPRAKPFQAGIYRLIYDTGAYFKGQGVKTFFPWVEVAFEIEKIDEHYHIPILLNPYGYSTYRGS